MGIPIRLSCISIIAALPAVLPAQGIKSPEVLSDGKVIFRVLAPKASEVLLSGDWMGPQPPVTMNRSQEGVWSVTAGPLEPNFYSYGFVIDGLRAADPACRCTFASGGRFASSSFTISGPAPEPWETRMWLAERSIRGSTIRRGLRNV